MDLVRQKALKMLCNVMGSVNNHQFLHFSSEVS